jgi:hypothetical protein
MIDQSPTLPQVDALVGSIPFMWGLPGISRDISTDVQGVVYQ